MQPDDIKTGHQYLIGVPKGRKVVAHVTNIADRNQEGATAKFLWRNAGYRDGWSRYVRQLPLSVFAHLATKEIIDS